MPRIPKLIKSSSVYMFFYGVSAFIPFLLLPILTRYLGSEAYGRIAMFNLLVMFLTPLIRFELQEALKREYVNDKTDFTSYLATATIFSSLVLLFFVAIWGVTQVFVDSLFGLSTFWLGLILLVAFGKAQWTNFISLMQIQDKVLFCGLTGLGITVFTFSATVYLVVFKEFDWQGRLWPELIIHFLILTPITLYMYKRTFSMRWNFDTKKLKEMLAFSLPLVPVAMGSYLMMTADRIFLTNMEGLGIVGLYSVAVQISSVIGLLVSSFRPSWEVWVYRNLGNITESGMKKTVIAMYGYGVFLLLIALSVIFIVPFVLPLLVGEEFLLSEIYMPWLILAGVMLGFYTWMAPFMLYIKKTKTLNYIIIFIAILNCVLNYILIKIFGSIGAAQATFISYFVGFVLLLSSIASHHNLPWLLRKKA